MDTVVAGIGIQTDGFGRRGIAGIPKGEIGNVDRTGREIENRNIDVGRVYDNTGLVAVQADGFVNHHVFLVGRGAIEADDDGITVAGAVDRILDRQMEGEYGDGTVAPASGSGSIHHEEGGKPKTRKY